MGENADIARRGLDVFVRQSFDEAQHLCSPDVELWTLFDEPGEDPKYSGRGGLRRWFERLRELWAFVEVQEVVITEHEGGWVLLKVSARVRGRGSPHELEPRVAVAVRVAGGAITKFGLFADEADAVAMIDAG